MTKRYLSYECDEKSGNRVRFRGVDCIRSLRPRKSSVRQENWRTVYFVGGG